MSGVEGTRPQAEFTGWPLTASGSWQRCLSLSGWCLGPLAFLPVVIKTSPAAVFTALLPITDAFGWNLGH